MPIRRGWPSWCSLGGGAGIVQRKSKFSVVHSDFTSSMINQCIIARSNIDLCHIKGWLRMHHDIEGATHQEEGEEEEYNDSHGSLRSGKSF